MKATTLRKKSIEELEEIAVKTKKEISSETASYFQDKGSGLNKIKDLKKDYARILTVLKEKKEKSNA